MGLGTPGGPIVDRRARGGDERAVPLPTTKLTHADRVAGPPTGVEGPFANALRYRTDFSFSGIKTAVLRYVRQRQAVLAVSASHGGGSADAPTAAAGFPLPDGEIDDICASFQRVVVETLLDRTFDAAEWFQARSVGIAGGVSANSRLRADAVVRGEKRGLPVFLPSLALSTDNAAMIAAAGLRRYHAGVRAGMGLNADASLPL